MGKDKGEHRSPMVGARPCNPPLAPHRRSPAGLPCQTALGPVRTHRWRQMESPSTRSWALPRRQRMPNSPSRGTARRFESQPGAQGLGDLRTSVSLSSSRSPAWYLLSTCPVPGSRQAPATRPHAQAAPWHPEKERHRAGGRHKAGHVALWRWGRHSSHVLREG